MNDLVSAMQQPQESLQQFLDQQQADGVGAGLHENNHIITPAPEPIAKQKHGKNKPCRAL